MLGLPFYANSSTFCPSNLSFLRVQGPLSPDKLLSPKSSSEVCSLSCSPRDPELTALLLLCDPPPPLSLPRSAAHSTWVPVRQDPGVYISVSPEVGTVLVTSQGPKRSWGEWTMPALCLCLRGRTNQVLKWAIEEDRCEEREVSTAFPQMNGAKWTLSWTAFDAMFR